MMLRNVEGEEYLFWDASNHHFNDLCAVYTKVYCKSPSLRNNK